MCQKLHERSCEEFSRRWQYCVIVFPSRDPSAGIYTRQLDVWCASRHSAQLRGARCNAPWIGYLETNGVMRWQWYSYRPLRSFDFALTRAVLFSRKRNPIAKRESAYIPHSQLALNVTVRSLTFIWRNLSATCSARNAPDEFTRETNRR